MLWFKAIKSSFEFEAVVVDLGVLKQRHNALNQSNLSRLVVVNCLAFEAIIGRIGFESKPSTGL